MKTMAAVLTQIRTPLEILEIELPPLKPGQELIKMAYSGLCHSQLNEVKGLKGEDKYLPHTLGHEGSGTVYKIGEGVTKVKPEDSVVLSWIKGKGADISGCQYSYKGKAINSGAISTFLQYTVVSENRLVPVSKIMPMREAALLGCALPTGAGVIRNEMKLQSGHSLAIFGLGGVGLSALIAAKQLGAHPLIAVDVQEHKLEKARQLGATHTYLATHETMIQELMAITSGKGVDFSFESAGKKNAMEQAHRCLKPGGLCILAGNLPKGEKIEIDPFDLILGKKIMGTWGGNASIDEDVPYYSDLFFQKKLPLQHLITHVIKLEEINNLIQELDAGRVGRGMISFE
jgi:S-(hydroxymethyl)glutathione dehydrogenase/alcohol dehydrogenase